MDDNKLPEQIYAWNYCGSLNTGLRLPVVDMGDTPWAVYTRMKLVQDLYRNTCNCEGDNDPCMQCAEDSGWNNCLMTLEEKRLIASLPVDARNPLVVPEPIEGLDDAIDWYSKIDLGSLKEIDHPMAYLIEAARRYAAMTKGAGRELL